MKKTLLLFTILFMIQQHSKAQVENAIDFDGIDDNVIVPTASSLIAGAGQISISCWVYPTNQSPSFPDYDGFCGFRNDVNADFYFVQISTSGVEARFRNSSGVAFDVIDSGLQLNVWQHYVLTYDGSELTLYRNAALVQSIPASGTISNTTDDFYIGNLIYSLTNYYLQGKIDEISLWNKALNANEVNCIYKSYPDSNTIGLLLYYRFNDGITAGNNQGLSTALPSTGSLPAYLNNFGLLGGLSNWVAGFENFVSTTANICPGQSVTFGTQTLTAPGIYYEAFNGSSGCDSVVRMDLSAAINIDVSLSGLTLTSAQSGGSYQWIDCDNGFVVVAGATSQSFSPTVNGNYAVIVTYNSCTDTSYCYDVLGVGVNSVVSTKNIQVFPNPSKDQIKLANVIHSAILEIRDIQGKVLLNAIVEKDGEMDISSLAKGYYIVNVSVSGSNLVTTLIKE